MTSENKKEVQRSIKNYLLSSEATSLGGEEMGFNILAEDLENEHGIDLHSTFRNLSKEFSCSVKGRDIVFFNKRGKGDVDFFLVYNPNLQERRSNDKNQSTEDDGVYMPVINLKKFSGATETFTSSRVIIDRHKAYWNSIGGNYKKAEVSNVDAEQKRKEREWKRDQDAKKALYESRRVASLVRAAVERFNSSERVVKVSNKYFLERGMTDIINFVDLRQTTVVENGANRREYMIPLYDHNFEIKNYQSYDEKGKKTFVKDIPVAGFFTMLGDPSKTTGPIIFAEGLSTLWSAKEMTQHWTLDDNDRVVEMDSTGYVEGKSPVYVFCLNSAGLTSVMSTFNDLYPNRLKIAMSDNDCHKIHAYNAGQSAASVAAYESGAINCKPVFKESDCQNFCPEDNPTDWHSYLKLYGLEAGKKAAFEALDYEITKIKYGDLLIRKLEIAGCTDSWQIATRIALPESDKTDPWSFIYGISLIQTHIHEKAFYSRDKSKDKSVRDKSGENIKFRHVENKSKGIDGQSIPTIKDIPVDTLLNILKNKSTRDAAIASLDECSANFINKSLIPFYDKRSNKISECVAILASAEQEVPYSSLVANLNEKTIGMVVEDREIKESLLENDKRKKSVKTLGETEFIKDARLSAGQVFEFSTTRYDIHEAYTRLFANGISKQSSAKSLMIKDILNASGEAEGRHLKVDLMARIPIVTKVLWTVTNKSESERSLVDILKEMNPDFVSTKTGFKRKENKNIFITRMKVNGVEIDLGKILLSNTFCDKVEGIINEKVRLGKFNTVSKDVIYIDHKEAPVLKKNKPALNIQKTPEMSHG